MTPIEYAQEELGVKEIPGKEDNPRIVEYHQTCTLRAQDDETSWCSAFVNWCVTRAGLKGTNSAWARSWLKWGVLLETPVPGCIVVFRRKCKAADMDYKCGHVAFFISETADKVKVLGGNQGNAVSIRAYAKADVLGYRAVNNEQ